MEENLKKLKEYYSDDEKLFCNENELLNRVKKI